MTPRQRGRVDGKWTSFVIIRNITGRKPETLRRVRHTTRCHQPMADRLRVKLLPGWADYSDENPDGPPTFLRDTSASPGPLQVSCAWYESGAVPNPNDDDLIALAKGV